MSVYKDWGPLKRWRRWLPEHLEIDAKSMAREIDRALETAMGEDDQKGATGEWVALLGFSQGAKLCPSLLF
jgi:predicted esterase